MSLRTRLFLLSLLTLTLPWAGSQYVREVELAQRSGQLDALAGSARTVASALRGRVDLLYRNDALAGLPGDLARDLFAPRLNGPIQIDGYADDWRAHGAADTAAGGAPDTLMVLYRAGVDARFLYLVFEVADDDVILSRAPEGLRGAQDQVLVKTRNQAGASVTWVFAAQGVGPLSAYRAEDGAMAPRILGDWQRTATGYNLEMRLPLDRLGTFAGFVVLDADRGAYTGAAGTVPVFRPFPSDGSLPDLGEPAAFLHPPDQLRAALSQFHQGGKRLRLLDRNGWILAGTGALSSLAPDNAGQHEPRILQRIYRAILDPDPGPPPDPPPRAGLATGPGLAAALHGEESRTWYLPRDSEKAVVSVAVPVRDGNRVIGVVVLEQTSDAVLTLTNRALTRLMNLTMLASVVAALGLLLFATWLSVRIGRLRDAAERALGPEGDIASDMPGQRARDELGDLSRSFSTLLGRLREYNEYLQNLASRLSHELRTPLAIVRSSLDNLDADTLPAEARTYAERAREGSVRLTSILSAMSEATRVEASIDGAEAEEFDLAELLAGMFASYRDLYPDRVFVCEIPDAQARMQGVPDLIVQMLDKLVENAVEFAPANGRIGIELSGEGNPYRLSVRNEGPPLPETMTESLFDSLVSLRANQGDTPHLGLGLYIVRLIVEFHGGTIRARNSASGDGVVFEISLPARPGVIRQ